MPKLVIKLAASAPADAEVARDGVALGAVSLAMPLPSDPGKHLVVVRAKGFDDRTFEIQLGEGETKELEVTAGAKQAEATTPPAPTTTPTATTVATTAAPLASAPRDLPPATGSTMRTTGLVIAGVGVVGLGVGTAFGLVAMSKQSTAGCNGNVCPSASAGATRDDAQNAGNLSTIFFLAGGALVVGGGALWLLAPKAKVTSLAMAGAGVLGLGVGTAFGLMAMSKKSDADAGCVGNVCTSVTAGAARSDARSAGDTSTAFFVAGGAVAAAGLTAWLLAPRSGAPRMEAVPNVGLNGAGVTLRGSF